MFLQNCPEAFKCLLDNCLVSSDQRFTDNVGKVVFDLFLFYPEHDDNELAIVDLVIAAGKKKLVEHPLFEAFIRWPCRLTAVTRSISVSQSESDEKRLKISYWV